MPRAGGPTAASTHRAQPSLPYRTATLDRARVQLITLAALSTAPLRAHRLGWGWLRAIGVGDPAQQILAGRPLKAFATFFRVFDYVRLRQGQLFNVDFPIVLLASIALQERGKRILRAYV